MYLRFMGAEWTALQCSAVLGATPNCAGCHPEFEGNVRETGYGIMQSRIRLVPRPKSIHRDRRRTERDLFDVM